MLLQQFIPALRQISSEFFIFLHLSTGLDSAPALEAVNFFHMLVSVERF